MVDTSSLLAPPTSPLPLDETESPPVLLGGRVLRPPLASRPAGTLEQGARGDEIGEKKRGAVVRGGKCDVLWYGVVWFVDGGVRGCGRGRGIPVVPGEVRLDADDAVGNADKLINEALKGERREQGGHQVHAAVEQHQAVDLTALGARLGYIKQKQHFSVSEWPWSKTSISLMSEPTIMTCHTGSEAPRTSASKSSCCMVFLRFMSRCRATRAPLPLALTFGISPYTPEEGHGDNKTLR
jgi:hypothetical protein